MTPLLKKTYSRNRGENEHFDPSQQNQLLWQAAFIFSKDLFLVLRWTKCHGNNSYWPTLPYTPGRCIHRKFRQKVIKHTAVCSYPSPDWKGCINQEHWMPPGSLQKGCTVCLSRHLATPQPSFYKQLSKSLSSEMGIKGTIHELREKFLWMS